MYMKERWALHIHRSYTRRFVRPGRKTSPEQSTDSVFCRQPQKIDHAGYTRYILRRNAPRYDSEGDEIDDEDAASAPDPALTEENPFFDIALEREYLFAPQAGLLFHCTDKKIGLAEILCPLKQPSELPDHPAMSQPYRSKALLTMTLAIEEKLRKERILLWRARNLHRQFLGDSSWMPCGKVETVEDRYIFETRPMHEESEAIVDGLAGGQTFQTREDPALNAEVINQIDEDSQKDSFLSHPQSRMPPNPSGDIDMADIPNDETESARDTKRPKTEDIDAMVEDLPQHTEGGESEALSNGVGMHSTATKSPQNDGHNRETETSNEAKGASLRGASDEDFDMQNGEEGNENQKSSSPEPPRRMTTRAQANATTTHENSTGSQASSSSADTADNIPSAHPLFLVPDNILPDKDFGLPPSEAEDTRRLLWSYIQKQDETVRGFEYMLEALLRACRMKDDVFEWCKTEGHVGELSDGEDWYDKEKWGLGEGEDLKKGADEDEVDNTVEERTTGKRGRGRRQ